MKHLALGLAALALLLSGCDNRKVPANEDGGAALDRGAGKQPDIPPSGGCGRPAGGCFSANDCAPGWACRGCGSDPCCPMCNACYGQCEPACEESHECGNGAFCKKTSCGAKTGKCVPLPPSAVCNDDGPPSCGCDGSIYDCEEAAWAAGTNVGGTGCKACSTLIKDYKAALDDAKQCKPLAGALQCHVKADNDLGCPCPTFVSGEASSMAKLAALKKAWQAQNCQLDCAALACPAPVSGDCLTVNGLSGRCNDRF